MKLTELTFVVQGPVVWKDNRNLTAECLKSIRNFYPGSKIILSTDCGMMTDNLDFDLVVLNNFNEPILIDNDRVGTIFSTNLQISSSITGLRKVDTPFVVRIRSDMIVNSNNLVTLLETRPKRKRLPRLTLTDDLVIVLNWSTVDPRKYLKLAHHPSDQVYAGNIKDVVSIFECPLCPIEFMRWYENHPYPKGAKHGDSLAKYRCESWIWYNFVKKFTNQPFDNSYDMSKELLEESLALMVHNLMVVTPKMAGVESLKNLRPSLSSKVKMLTYLDWVRLSRNYGVSSRYRFGDFESVLILFVRFIIDIFKRIDFVFPEPAKHLKKK
jgi:hypothetical protein